MLGDTWAPLAAYIGIFLAALVVCYVAGMVLLGFITTLKLRGTDRMIGAALGAGKGFLICGVLALAVLLYMEEQSNVRREVARSPSATAAARSARAIWEAIPPGRKKGEEDEDGGLSW